MSFGGATGHMNKSIQSNRALHKSIGTNYERRKDLVIKKTLDTPITKRKTERKAVDSATLFASQQRLRRVYHGTLEVLYCNAFSVFS